MARVVCLVHHSPDRISFTWSEGPDAFPTYSLTGQTADRFRERVSGVHEAGLEPIEGVRDRLRNLVGACHDATGPDGLAAEDVRRAGLELAQAGFELRRLAFAPNDDPGKAARDVAKWLAKLHAQGAIESLELIAEGGPPVPWTLLYETKPDPAAFLTGGAEGDHWRGFWGLRFNLACGQRVDPRRRMPWWTAPTLVMVVDPLVREGLPEPIRTRLDAFVAARGLSLVGSRAELDAALAGGRPDILYWLGHASPEALVLGEGPGSEVRPNDLLDLLAGDGDAPPGGLVFLNACRTAEASPTAGSFVRAVFEQKMGGLIATEQQTIDTFAAPLGLDFLEAFLDRGETVGAAMQALRARVPLGLLYGTYCPPEIRVVRPADAPAGVPVPVALAAALPGVKLGSPAPRAARPPGPRDPLPEHPYRSLRAYGVGDRALFAGRDDDVLRFARVLDDPGTRVLLLHGESGVGKTSFLRAGVIPYLETECVGYRFTRDRAVVENDPILLVRATNDPVSQIAAALCLNCAKPLVYRTPEGAEVVADLPGVLAAALGGRTGPDTLRDAMRADPDLFGRLMAAIDARVPFAPVLVIDQAEEVFTLARTPADEANRVAALDMLRRAAAAPGGFKVVVSLRTEYHGRFVDRLRKGTRDGGGVREYLLTDFGLDALIEVIRRPTSETPIEYAAEVPFEKYRFRFAPGLAEEVAGRARAFTINRQDSVLPLVQVMCTQLYAVARTHPDGTVTRADIERIGGFEGGMKRHAEGLVRRLFPNRADRVAFKHLLTDDETQLYLRQADGTLTTALLPADHLARHWTGRTPFDRVLAAATGGDWRLLRINSLRIGEDETERPYVSLGHDALAKVAARWDDELRRKRQFRKYLVAVSGLAVVMVGLAALTWWAFEQQAIAAAAAVEARKLAKEAKQERETAEGEREKAVAERAKAEGERKKAERQEYLATVQLADALWDNQPDASVARLEHYWGARPAAGLDYPGFEWNYQWRRTRLAMQPLVGHEVFVRSAAYSADGTKIVTAGADRTAKVWDAATGAPLLTLTGHAKMVFSAAFSADGTRIVTAGADGTARVWNAATGDAVRTLTGHAEMVISAAFSADGTRIVTAGADGTARVWNAATGDVVRTLTAHGKFVASAAFSADGTRIVTAGEDGTAMLWDAATGKTLHTMPGHAGAVWAAALSPDEAWVITAGNDGAVIVWNAATGGKVRSLTGHRGAVYSAAFSPDGARVVSAGDDRLVRVWDAATGERLLSLAGHGAWVNTAAFRPDGARVVTASDDGTARVWEVATREAARTLPGLADSVHSFSFGADGTRAVTAGDDSAALLLDATGGKAFAAIAGPFGRLVSEKLSAAVKASKDRTARVWDPTTGKAVVALTGHTANVSAAALSADGARAVTGSEDSTAKLWDAATGTEIRTFAGHAGPVRAAALGANGARVVTAGEDKTAKLWDAATGTLLVTFTGHDDVVWSAALSPDGTRVVTGSRDKTARVWDAATGAEIHKLTGHAFDVAKAAFSPDGGRIVTGSHDKSARVWDAVTGKSLLTLTGHGGAVHSVAFSPDGTRIVTASSDKTARVWDAATGDALVTLSGHSQAVLAAAFSADGRRVFTGSRDGTTRVWDGRPFGP